LKDYYKILGVAETADSGTIKKAYRKLALKFHPDKNPNSKTAESKFKEVADAYDTLGDTKKKMDYDLKRKPRNSGGFGGGNGSSFEDFINDYANRGFEPHAGRKKRSNPDFGRRNGGFKSAMPDLSYLDIKETLEINIVDAIIGTTASVNYGRWLIDGEFKRSNHDRTLNVKLNLKDKHTPITKVGDGYQIKMKLEKLGHEDVNHRSNIWGEAESMLVAGDYYLTLKLNFPEDMIIEDDNIIQYIDIPLYQTLFPGEKIRITTFLDKSYDAEISTPKKLNDLKFNIKGQGIKNANGTLGNYIIRFNVIPPDLSNIDKNNLDIIKESFIQE
jgi:DnaJ-class molecular chaperone